MSSNTAVKTRCAHCGDHCESEVEKELAFCCNGCEQIYILLKENNLDQYYDLESFPGIKKKEESLREYSFLDDEETTQRLIVYSDQMTSKIQLTLPSIHCVSCLWLLENLHKLHSGITKSTVNFLEKRAFISFNHDEIKLSELVTLLDRIGYTPELSFASLEHQKDKRKDRSLLLKIGVAGFAFGNIMLLSFPEYLGLHGAFKSYYLGYINIALAIPVLLYSGNSYLKNAYRDLKQKHLGLDAPIALGMLALFFRSIYEITSGTGEGYLDSFAGFILFLLIGQWFQLRTYKLIDFDRDYKNYFPISVDSWDKGQWRTKSIDKIVKHEKIRIKNGEIIPCDGILLNNSALIDYSFVTGESDAQQVENNSKIYAGGKVEGSSVQLRVENDVEHAYLTQLWKDHNFKAQRKSKAEKRQDLISKYYSITVVLIAVLTFLYWSNVDLSVAYNSFTAVLIVACPCALALSVPFLMGNAMRILAKKHFHTKSANVLERLVDIDTVVFDKTGTITENSSIMAEYSGSPLTEHELDLVYSTTSQSNHPLSKAIHASIVGEQLEMESFHEDLGQGITAYFDKIKVKIGSPKYILGSKSFDQNSVLVEIGERVLGSFNFKKKVRPYIQDILNNLDAYEVKLLSGDNENEKERMKLLFPVGSDLNFNLTPEDKLKHIQHLQNSGRKVMMIGDGLNDSGALKQSDVGIVLVEDNNTFTPACDVVMSTKSLKYFSDFRSYARKLNKAVIVAFIIAFLYNTIGLSFAITGRLSPLVAAILMPLSSITIILYSLLVSRFLARKIIHKTDDDQYEH